MKTKGEIVEDYAHDFRNMEMEKSELRKVFEEFGEAYHEAYHNRECPQCGEVWNEAEDDHCPHCDYGQDDDEDLHPQRYGDQER